MARSRAQSWVLVHEVRAGAGTNRIAVLRIEGVPANSGEQHVLDTLAHAGRVYGDGGIPWGNHHAIPLSHAKDVNALDRAERVSYEELLKPDDSVRRIVLRAPAADYALIRLAAARCGTSMQEWLLGVAREAAKGR